MKMGLFLRQWRQLPTFRIFVQRPNQISNNPGRHRFSLVRRHTTGVTGKDNSQEISSEDEETKSRTTPPFNSSIDLYGRNSILDRLEQIYTLHRRAALIGLEGIGKSAITIKYAERHLEKQPQTPVFWIKGYTPASLKQSYSQLADALRLAGRNDYKANVTKLVYEHLSNEKNGPWFMVLDDVNHQTLLSMEYARRTGSDHDRPLSSLLPKASHGLILITSQNRCVAEALTENASSIIPIHALEESDSINLLCHHSQDKSSPSKDAKQLANYLDNHPLALTQAAAYISNRRPKMSITKYMSTYQKPKSVKSLWTGIDSSVSRTCQLAFDRIRKKHPGSFEVLSLMCIFHFEDVPAFLFSKNRRKYEADNYDFEKDVIEPLVEYSMITRNGDTFSMHKTVHQATRSWLQANNSLHHRVREALTLILDNFPETSDSSDQWSGCQRLLPHAQSALSLDVGPENPSQRQLRGNLLYKVAYFEYETGDHDAALKHFRQAQQIQSEILKPDDEQLKQTMHMIQKLQHTIPHPLPQTKHSRSRKTRNIRPRRTRSNSTDTPPNHPTSTSRPIPPKTPLSNPLSPQNILLTTLTLALTLTIAFTFELSAKLEENEEDDKDQDTRLHDQSARLQELEVWIGEMREGLGEGMGQSKGIEQDVEGKENEQEKGEESKNWNKWFGNSLYALAGIAVSKLL